METVKKTNWGLAGTQIDDNFTANKAEIDANTANKTFGDAINNTEFAADGTMRRNGTATAWQDMIGNLFGSKLNSTSGQVDYDFDSNSLKFSQNGSLSTAADRVQANLEINHQFRVGTSITFSPHIHWFQEIETGAAKAITLSMRYRLQKNGEAQTAAWTTITCDTGSGGDDIYDFTAEADGLYNQLSKFPDITVDCDISDTFQFQAARTDTDDELGSQYAYVYFIDFHGEVDSDGSDEEYTKV